MSSEQLQSEAAVRFVLERAKAHGATAADALFVHARRTSVRVRLGEVERVEQSRDKGVGLRVLVGQRTATTSSSDLDRERLEGLVARTCAAARVIAEDPASGLPDAGLIEDLPDLDLDLYDAAVTDLTVDDAIETATTAEAVSLDADERISNSEGAEMSWGARELFLASTEGVERTRRSSSASFWTTPVAEAGGKMERDYWWTSARYREDLEAPEAVGREAARRALRRLGARKPETCQVPVIFEAPIASRLLGSIAGAISGSAVYRKATWLLERLGEPGVFAPGVRIVDDPHVRRGPGSKDFDGEGLATRRLVVVEGGQLQSWLLDCYTARKLGLETTRHAARGLGGTPAPSATNLWMDQGEGSLSELVRATERGLLVTELFGFGVNTVTGDYSQGAAGLWIEGGEIAYPVSELTIASTLPTIWSTVDRVAADADRRRSVSAPSFRVPRMTVAGS